MDLGNNAWLFELRATNEDELLNMDLGNNGEDTYVQHMMRNCQPLLQGLGQGLGPKVHRQKIPCLQIISKFAGILI